MMKHFRLATIAFCIACFAGFVPSFAEEPNESMATLSPMQSAMIIEQVAPGEKVTVQFVVYFPLNSYEIDSHYMGNAESLRKIDETLKSIGPNNITSIEVITTASPEGTVNRNDWLAQKRSEAIKKYFAKKYPTFKGNLKTKEAGEDWDDLRQQIKNDKNLSEATKSRVLKTIDSADRKTEIKKLGSDSKVGDVYEYLAKTYYPSLRKADISMELPEPKKEVPVVKEEPVVKKEEPVVKEEPIAKEEPVEKEEPVVVKEEPVVVNEAIAEAPKTESVEVVKEPVVKEGFTKLSGRIIDAITREPVAGVRVEGFGNNRYTSMTRPDGTFDLNIPEAITSLYVSTPGYNSVIIPACQPKKDIEIYDEVFTPFAKNEFDVTAKAVADINTNTALSVEGEIQRQLGGDIRLITRSGTPGMGALMMIQGINTLNSSTQPLVVLDGVVQDLQDGYASVHDGFFNNILAGIDVEDIEKVTVLKNGTSIYGAKGANGVILIDTRRGHSMATRIDAVAYGGYTMEPNLPTMMNDQQYRILANELMGGVETRQNRFPFLWDYPNYYYNMYHNNTKWSDYVYREAWSQNYKVNVQGGDDAAMYNFSLGYSDAESTILCNDFNRLNIRFNTDVVLADNLKTRFDIAYSRINRNLRNDGIQPDFDTAPVSAPGFLSLIKSPFLSPYKYNNDGTLSPMLEGADTYANFDVNTRNNTLGNPISIFEYAEGNNKNIQEYTMFDVTFAPEWKLGKGFVLNGLFNYTLHRTNEKSFRPMTGMPNFYISGLGYSANEVRCSSPRRAASMPMPTSTGANALEATSSAHLLVSAIQTLHTTAATSLAIIQVTTNCLTSTPAMTTLTKMVKTTSGVTWPGMPTPITTSATNTSFRVVLLLRHLPVSVAKSPMVFASPVSAGASSPRCRQAG